MDARGASTLLRRPAEKINLAYESLFGSWYVHATWLRDFGARFDLSIGVSTGPAKRGSQAQRCALPEDFLFQLTEPEAQNLRSQIATSSWGGRRYWLFVFTEYGAIQAITGILKTIRELMNPPVPKKRPIGFTANLDE